MLQGVLVQLSKRFLFLASKTSKHPLFSHFYITLLFECNIVTYTHIFNKNNYLSVTILLQSCYETSLLLRSLPIKSLSTPPYGQIVILTFLLPFWHFGLDHCLHPLNQVIFAYFLGNLVTKCLFATFAFFSPFAPHLSYTIVLFSSLTRRRVPRIQPLFC